MNVFVYIDALPFDCITQERAPFIRSLVDHGFSYPLQNIMGYSFGIQSTILSGELPARTKHWMPYVHAPYTNIFGFRALAPLARMAGIDVDRHRLLRTARYGMTSRLILRRGAQTSSIPLSIADKFYIYPYYYMNELPSFKELESELSVTYGSKLLYFGPCLQRREATRHATEYLKSLAAKPTSFEKTLLVLYVDSLDHRGHGYGVGSRAWALELAKIDRDLKDFYVTLEKITGNFASAIFSDHGMCNIEHTIDILKPLRLMGLSWKDINLFVDATIVNIWLGKRISASSLRRSLERISQDRFIVFDKKDDANLLREVGVPIDDDNCVGDIIIQARPGYMFFPNFYSDIKSFTGSHGYFPDEECQKSFLSVNMNAEKGLSVHPTHIKDVRKLLLSLATKT